MNAQQPLPGDDFEPAMVNYGGSKDSWQDEEKIEFPSYNTSVPIPTYADVPPPPPIHMTFAPRTLGPRFYGGGNAGAGAESDQSLVSVDTRVDPIRVDLSSTALSRVGSGSSQKSGRSVGSSIDQRSGSMRMGGKRWVIE